MIKQMKKEKKTFIARNKLYICVTGEYISLLNDHGQYGFVNL